MICKHGNKHLRCKECYLERQPKLATKARTKRTPTYKPGWDKYYATHDIDHDHSMNS